MTVYYVKSTTGNNANDGLTWATAKETLVHIAGVAVGGDTVYVSHLHAETVPSGAFSATWAGSISSPVIVLCVNDGAEPPTTLAETASVSTTSTGGSVQTGFAYVRGIIFNVGSGASTASFSLQVSTSLSAITFDTCSFRHTSTSTGSTFSIGQNTNGNAAQTTFKDCTFKFGSNSSNSVLNINHPCTFYGGGMVSGTGNATQGFIQAGRTTVNLYDFDLSNFTSTTPLIKSCVGTVGIYDCKLPASWTGSLIFTAPAGRGSFSELANTDSTDTNYRYSSENYMGTVRSETVVVRTGGASDGTTPQSLKMVSTANTKFWQPLESPVMPFWNETVGSSITVTIEVLTDSTTNLTDADIYLEVREPGTSGSSLGISVNDRAAGILTTPTDQTSSSVTWTTTGITNPLKQKVEVTFTPQEKGWIKPRVCLSKASTTVYVCPEPTVT